MNVDAGAGNVRHEFVSFEPGVVAGGSEAVMSAAVKDNHNG
jgi:hypothetical protein